MCNLYSAKRNVSHHLSGIAIFKSVELINEPVCFEIIFALFVGKFVVVAKAK